MDKNEQNDETSEVYQLSRRRLIAGFGGLALGAVGAASLGGTAGAATRGKVEKAFSEAARTSSGNLIIDLQTEPQGYCPLQYPNGDSVWIQGQIAEPLYWYNNAGEFAPLLAAGLPQTTDGKTYTIDLKPGITFHNGDPFTASDVAATLLATMVAPTNVFNGQLGTVSSATAVSATQVTFTMAAPNYCIPHLLAIIPMMNQNHLADETGIIGTGPFMWGTLTSGSNLVLNANPNYHLGAPPLASVTFQFVPDADARVVDALTGVSNIILLPPFSDLAELKANKKLKLINHDATVMLPLHVSTTSKAFKDVRVRQALGFAMDRTRVNDIVFAGQAEIFHGGVLPPVMLGFNPKNNYFPAKPNLKKAKALLEAAGVKHVEFTAYTYAGSPNPLNAMAVIQQDIAKAGFIANIVAQPLAEFATTLTSHKFDMCVSYEFNGTWWAKDGINQLANYESGVFPNWVDYENKAFDELLAKSRATKSPTEQIALWKQANEILTVAAVNLIPVVPHLTGAMGTNVKGFPQPPLEFDYLRLATVSL
jgi:peptide/nickel transport system substrate-binding protein